MACICSIASLSSLHWLLFLGALVALMWESQSVSVPLNHKINGYVTRQGNWSSVYKFSSLTLGGRETYPLSEVHLSYVVRVKLANEIIPGKFVSPSHNGPCFLIDEGTEKNCTLSQYEFLYNEPYFTWVGKQGGDICNGAIVGGISKTFENYYICRFDYYEVKMNITQVLLGKLVPSRGLCLAGWYGQRTSSVYEVLGDSRYA